MLVSACSASPAASPTVAAVETTEASLSESSPEAEVTVVDSPEARGAALFVETRGDFACATCHYSSEARLAGPGLANIAARFEGYGLEGTVEEYIRNSIISPQVFIAPGEPAYPESIMPLTYSALFSEEEINDLIAYILSL